MNTLSAIMISILIFVTQPFNGQNTTEIGWHLIGRPRVTPTITAKPNVSPISVVLQPTATPTIVLIPESTSVPVQSTPTDSPTSQSSTDSNDPSAPVIDSVSPNVANFGQEVTIKGIGFGTSPGFVNFRESDNEHVAIYEAGAPILSWSDNEILVSAPAFSGADLTTVIEVIGQNNMPSNQIRFTIIEGQPIIDEVPYSTSPGRDISLRGSGFGTEKGEVKIYDPANLSNPVGICTIGFYLPTQSPTWWDDHIKCSIPDLPQKGEGYAFEVVTSKGTRSSVTFIQICDVEGCG